MVPVRKGVSRQSPDGRSRKERKARRPGTTVPIVSGIAALFASIATAGPNLDGQTGLIHMPDATLDADGTFRFGGGYHRPYQPWWFNLTLLPALEFSGRYTTIRGLQGFQDDQGFGDYKDKAFDIKLRLHRQSGLLPDVAVGLLDFTGTRLFESKYIALTRHLDPFEVTLGYGQGRIDGLFGGIRFRPPDTPRLSLLAEYDANDYARDFRAALSGADNRDGGWTFGIDYRYGWLGGQVSVQHGDTGVLGYIAIPFMDKEFIPKIEEPPPYSESPPKVAIAQWQANTDYAARIGRVLARAGFRNVLLGFDGRRLKASLTNVRISEIGRAVGRAARILHRLGPRETEEIEITYTADDLPLITYRFRDPHKLERYLQGLLSKQQLMTSIDIEPADPAQFDPDDPAVTDLSLLADEADRGREQEDRDDGGAIRFHREDNHMNLFEIIPFNVAGFFNDPSGAYKYDLFAVARYRHRFHRGLFLDAAARLSLIENVSDVKQPSNSLLPHVRSDVAEYQRHQGLKLRRLTLTQLFKPTKQLFGRVSAGYYEDMFGGLGGQILYLPDHSRWAVDLSLDWVKQRDFDGRFGFRDYDTVTALGALHYRIPRYGVTATLRGGRFLAGDSGVRFEIKRRFRSGIEFGGWYTITDGNDITSPGSPDHPYNDKGVFLSIPLNIMLTKDTQATASFRLSPWTRDVGQMVESPYDLYRQVEQRLPFGAYGTDLMTDFGQ